MVSKAEIEAQLHAAGAFYASDMDDLHELWVTPWGFEIWVPMAGPFGQLDVEDLQEILEEITASKPP